ncbi:MAG: caspase family protein, partial [Candidatus Rokubacteria bacterium]|nr:caspase family protein [Candidatus Rokubacteria bacterium]
AKRFKDSFFDGIKVVETELVLGRALQDTLALSFPQIFDRVTVVRTPPRTSGGYHAVLVPRILGGRWEYSVRFTGADVRYVVSGSLTARDQAGNELMVVKEDGQAASFLAAGIGEPGFGSVVSQAIGDLVRKWGEQMAASLQMQQYASRFPPAVAASGAAAGRPPGSEITISLSHPIEGARVAEETIAVVGLVTAAKDIQRLDLAVNGQPLPIVRDVRVQSTGVRNHQFTAQVPLRAGQNLITLTAVDSAGQAAQAVRTVVREAGASAGTAAGKPGAGERWAVVIGIDQYRNPSIASLRYATADAEAVFRLLTTKGGVKPENARLLLNEQATQRALRQVLGDVLRQKALKDDEVIIYYAGHGTTEPDAGAEGGLAKYLVPWDADPESLFSTAIPMEEVDRVFGRLAARKILLIQDTCFSGGAGGRTFLAKGLARRSLTLTDKFLQELTQKEGRMILTASDINQVSLEDRALRHGVFTHYLLEGLKGAADLDGDRAVTVRELHLFLQRRVHEHSSGVQTPQLYNIGDMVLTTR